MTTAAKKPAKPRNRAKKAIVLGKGWIDIKNLPETNKGNNPATEHSKILLIKEKSGKTHVGYFQQWNDANHCMFYNVDGDILSDVIGYYPVDALVKLLDAEPEKKAEASQ